MDTPEQYIQEQLQKFDRVIPFDDFSDVVTSAAHIYEIPKEKAEELFHKLRGDKEVGSQEAATHGFGKNNVWQGQHDAHGFGMRAPGDLAEPKSSLRPIASSDLLKQDWKVGDEVRVVKNDQAPWGAEYKGIIITINPDNTFDILDEKTDTIQLAQPRRLLKNRIGEGREDKRIQQRRVGDPRGLGEGAGDINSEVKQDYPNISWEPMGHPGQEVKNPRSMFYKEGQKALTKPKATTRPISAIELIASIQSRMADLINRWRSYQPKAGTIADAEARIRQLAEADPTGDTGSYIDWILKLDKEHTSKFPEDTSIVRRALELFIKLKQHPSLVKKDINRYTNLGELQEALAAVSKKTVEREESAKYLSNPPAVIKSEGPYKVLKFTDPEQLTSFCEKAGITGWCISPLSSSGVAGDEVDEDADEYEDEGEEIDANANAAHYLSKGPAYIVLKNNDVFVFANGDLTDKFNTHPLPEEKAREVAPLLEGLSTHFGLVPYFSPEGRKKAEAVIAKDPDLAFGYVEVIKGRWPAGEAVIAKDPKFAYWYAKDVIKGRWPEAEAVIAKSPGIAVLYAEFIKSLDKKGQKDILYLTLISKIHQAYGKESAEEVALYINGGIKSPSRSLRSIIYRYNIVATLNVEKALGEVKGKTVEQINTETAWTWGSRAAACFKLSNEASSEEEKDKWYRLGEDCRHEALEHASLSEDEGKLVGEISRALASFQK